MSDAERRGRTKFSKEEDEKLKSLVEKYGCRHWVVIASEMGGKTARQCRERYGNYLQPGITNGPWTDEEEEKLRQKVAEIGPKWAKMTTFFPERSEVNLKNHWAAISRQKKHCEVVEKPAVEEEAKKTVEAPLNVVDIGKDSFISLFGILDDQIGADELNEFMI